MTPPGYFEQVRQNALRRWEQLEADPELAGPWHQLFKQVQSPPHVLSELLQNADDAGATKASARIVAGEFIFEHNGDDFTADQFASLCRFAFSNKRTLHTIGFRGVGFKSTFSLGDDVEVETPTLAVRFNCARFTLPEWVDGRSPEQATVVRVRVGDEHRLRELEQSLASWQASPASLLFFRNLSELELSGRLVKRVGLGSGPVENSEIVALTVLEAKESERTDRILVVQSGAEMFPSEAMREIRKERNITDEEMPPCCVDLVFGLPGQQRLYVVLPTGAQVELPFSINAPFIQDPARYGVKDPSTSPTNRWLLQRAGKLAAAVLKGWVGNAQLSVDERAKSYGLLPKAEEPAADSNGRVTACVRAALLDGVREEPIMLGADGGLTKPGECFGLPRVVHGVWSDDELTGLFGSDQRKLLNAAVAMGHRSALQKHGWLKNLDSDDVITVLQAAQVSPPKPSSWAKLHALWTFICESINRYWDDRTKKIKMVPVVGENSLRAAEEVVRLPGKRDLLSAEDWKFVTDNAFAVDGDWLEWLAQQKSKKAGEGERGDEPASVLLRDLGLAEATSVDKIVAAASRKVFQLQSVPLEQCVQFAQILAALGATVPAGFQYATRELKRRDSSLHVVYDPHGVVEDLTSAKWSEEHLLHDDYTNEFKSCTAQAWEDWVASGKSGLHLALPVVKKEQHFWGRHSFEEHLRQLGVGGPAGYPYSSGRIDVEDWFFDDEVIRHWRSVADVKPDLHVLALESILKGPPSGWEDKLDAEAHQNGRVYKRRLNCGPIPSAWIALFRSKRCLRDTHGNARLPAELLLRTPDTEVLRDIEPFVAAELDTSANRRLLELLGARSTPSGTKKIIERLKAVTLLPNPAALLIEISKLYEALDRIVGRCAPAELRAAAESFEQEAIVLSESGEWVTSGEICIRPDEDGDAGCIHHLFRNLSMWPRLGVAERPAFERSLEWLSSLPSGGRIEGAAVSRVRSILRREPKAAWETCGHWLSLGLTWEPVGRLVNRQTSPSIGKWEGLAPGVKQATADLRMVPEVVWQQPPFAPLRELVEAVEYERTDVRESGSVVPKAWLRELGRVLCRVKCEDEQHTLHVRGVAERLRQTEWQPISRLEVTPYVDGVPAGTPMTPRVLWQELKLYVHGGTSVARLHKELAEELGRPFNDRSVTDAITACIERDAGYVAEFLADQFELEDEQELPLGEGATSEASDGGEIEGSGSPEATEPEAGGEGEAAEGEAEETGEVASRKQGGGGQQARPGSTPKPDLVDRYAAKWGFKWHPGEKCYAHSDGRWIERAEAPFHWVEKTAQGQATLRLWVQEQTLAQGIEVPAEVWSLLRSDPKCSALLLKDAVEAPVVFSGETLAEMQGEKRVTLYPARYRIVENHE